VRTWTIVVVAAEVGGRDGVRTGLATHLSSGAIRKGSTVVGMVRARYDAVADF
jgi:hypothetical protein